MIINTIIGRYHNIKINFFYSRPLFLIWYRNQKERKHADRAAFEKKKPWLEHFSNILSSKWLTLLSLFLRSCKLRGWRCTIWKIRIIPPAIIFKSSRELLPYFRRFKGNFLSCCRMTLWFFFLCFLMSVKILIDGSLNDTEMKCELQSLHVTDECYTWKLTWKYDTECHNKCREP